MEPGFIELDGRKHLIERVVGVFQVTCGTDFPFPRLSITILQRDENHFVGLLDVVIRNPDSGELEHTCGLGQTADAALLDAIRSFYGEVSKHSNRRELTENDFVWRVGNRWSNEFCLQNFDCRKSSSEGSMT